MKHSPGNESGSGSGDEVRAPYEGSIPEKEYTSMDEKRDDDDDDDVFVESGDGNQVVLPEVGGYEKRNDDYFDVGINSFADQRLV